MVRLTDLAPETEQLLEEVLRGLSLPQKTLPCKLLYDERGSQLYNRICELQEYYPARTETAIMLENAREIADLIGPQCLLIEYGSGSSDKTRVLLETLENLAAYVPIDISREHLLEAARDINRDYPDVEVVPVCADYTSHIDLPVPRIRVAKTVVYFPGSTIGNFEPEEAVGFLDRVADLCGPGDGLLIGADLQKDSQTLIAAYDDAEGVTAEFNLNLLRHLNNELGADFDLEQFRHKARYDEGEGRVEMHLVSVAEQEVVIDDRAFSFGQGESIWTEASYKYTLESFAEMVARAGFSVDHVWTDRDHLFSVQYLTR